MRLSSLQIAEKRLLRGGWSLCIRLLLPPCFPTSLPHLPSLSPTCSPPFFTLLRLPGSSQSCPVPVQVNGIDLRKATHDEAINVLRQTPQRVRLTLYRDEAPYKEEDMYDTLTIELQKKPGKGLGLSIVGKR